MPARSVAILPSPPISPTKRPPGRSTEKTPLATASGIQHPVERGVGKSGVELPEAQRLAGKTERLRIRDEGVDAPRARRFDHLGEASRPNPRPPPTILWSAPSPQPHRGSLAGLRPEQRSAAAQAPARRRVVA
jgi:hypothetical protein